MYPLTTEHIYMDDVTLTWIVALSIQHSKRSDLDPTEKMWNLFDSFELQGEWKSQYIQVEIVIAVFVCKENMGSAVEYGSLNARADEFQADTKHCSELCNTGESFSLGFASLCLSPLPVMYLLSSPLGTICVVAWLNSKYVDGSKELVTHWYILLFKVSKRGRMRLRDILESFFI